MRRFVLPGLAALGLVLATGILAAAEVIPGSSAPAWKLPDLDGKTVQFSDFKGKVVILDFWATWCLPCVAEVPRFIDLQKKYRDKGVVFVGVAMYDTKPAVAAFAKKIGINYPIVLGDDAIDVSYGELQGFPTTFVIDRAGKISAVRDGTFPDADLEKEIHRVL